MRATNVIRRRFGTIAAVLALAATMIGCAEWQGPAAPTAAAGAPALQGDPALGPQLAAVRDATNQYHDVNVAMAAGYPDPTGRPCEEAAAGAMGIHVGNFSLMTSNVDPLQPEVLLYLPKPKGGFRLIGVEYVQFVFLRNPTTGVVAPWTSPTPWPANYQVVTPTPQLFGQTFQGPMPGHVPGMPWHWDLHAWIWANNPNGIFAQWNPALSCN